MSKGKGFAGGMKRHNFKGQGGSHGNHKKHRSPGSIGACATPARVFKGTRMAGRMGGHQVTTLNLEVVQADEERELVLVKGAVPGREAGSSCSATRSRARSATGALVTTVDTTVRIGQKARAAGPEPGAQVDRRRLRGTVLGTVDLDPEWFGLEPNVALMHQVVVPSSPRRRSGTQSTKTRAEVAGGGAKPFRQKGMGRSRQGSIRVTALGGWR